MAKQFGIIFGCLAIGEILVLMPGVDIQFRSLCHSRPYPQRSPDRLSRRLYSGMADALTSMISVHSSFIHYPSKSESTESR